MEARGWLVTYVRGQPLSICLEMLVPNLEDTNTVDREFGEIETPRRGSVPGAGYHLMRAWLAQARHFLCHFFLYQTRMKMSLVI